MYTASGWPAVSTPVLRQLAGKPGAALAALATVDTSGAACACNYRCQTTHVALGRPCHALIIGLMRSCRVAHVQQVPRLSYQACKWWGCMATQ